MRSTVVMPLSLDPGAELHWIRWGSAVLAGMFVAVAVTVGPALADGVMAATVEVVADQGRRSGTAGLVTLAVGSLLVLASRPIIPGRRASEHNSASSGRH